MTYSNLLYSFLLQAIFSSSLSSAYSGLFREYIGAKGKGVTFAQVPIHPDVEFHFILSFAIDYTAAASSSASSSPNPTNGLFAVFWDSATLNPTAIAAVKRSHPNVMVALSVGGATVGNGTLVRFQPSSADSWLANAVPSLTKIIEEYGLDGIDIDYEQFLGGDDDTFTECIGRLIATLKENGVISFASIAPFDDEPVQSHYLALWKKYGSFVDYVNFQFYAYANTTTVSQFLEYFAIQNSSYGGGKVLVGVAATDGAGGGGLSEASGFFDACCVLQRRGELRGIFVWSADDSERNGFQLESLSQNLLANNNSSDPCAHGCSTPSGAGGGFHATSSCFYYFVILLLFYLVM